MKRRKKNQLSRKEKHFFSIFSSKIFFFFLILILAGIVKICFGKFQELSWAKDILTSQEVKIKEQKERKEKLKRTFEDLQSEEYLMRILKEKLNLVKPGERVIYILPEEEKKEEVIEGKSFLERLKNFFKRD